MDSPCLLKLLLFFTFLTTGASLKCETCTGVGRNCSGTMKTCNRNQPTCVIIYTVDTFGGVSQDETTKGCGTKYRCAFPAVYFNMGFGRIYRSHWICCVGDQCKNTMVTLPQVVTKKNGKQCRGCHAWGDTCKPKMVDCTGNNYKCFEMSSHVELANGSHIDRTMMGCTDDAVCNSMQKERTQFWIGSENIQKARCESMEMNSHGSRPTALLLAPFSALLLIKIFM